MPADPTITDPGLYRVVFENDRVRVLEYRDRPRGPDFVELKEPSPAGSPAGELPLGPGS